MIVKVLKERPKGLGFESLGHTETAHELPAVGDTLWVRTHGPFKVVERTFHFEKERDGDRPEDVTLTVRDISKTPVATSIPMRG